MQTFQTGSMNLKVSRMAQKLKEEMAPVVLSIEFCQLFHSEEF